jgi:galactose mutarotase-like enzyme
VIALADGPLRLALDPGRGGEIVSLTADGVELLFRAPWPQDRAADPTASDEAWVDAWPGGWQLLFPNAGTACMVGARRHPFHGDASAAVWEVETAGGRAATLAWRDPDGIAVRRTVSLGGRSVRVATELENTGGGRAPFVLVEHLILGPPLLGDETTIELAGGELLPLADEGPPTGEPAPWPGPADWSRTAPAPSSRFGAVVRPPARRVRVRVANAGLAVTLSWSEMLPHLWLWEERGSQGAPPWSGRTHCLGVEPASVPTGEGLAAALERGDAGALQPGERWTAAVELRVDATGVA